MVELLRPCCCKHGNGIRGGWKLKASLGSKRVLFSYFIITEPTELKLS